MLMNIIIFLTGFALSLGNALVAMPKGADFTVGDVVMIPLVCFLVAFGNAGLAIINRGEPGKFLAKFKKGSG